MEEFNLPPITDSQSIADNAITFADTMDLKKYVEEKNYKKIFEIMFRFGDYCISCYKDQLEEENEKKNCHSNII